MLNPNPWTSRGMIFFGVLFLSFGAETCHAQGKPDNAKALLKERRELLSEIASQLLMARGRAPFQEVIQAERDSLKADLDWFDLPHDRIGAIGRHKEVGDTLLKYAMARFLAGRVAEYEVLQARAYVVEVKIELLKEKRKAKPVK